MLNIFSIDIKFYQVTIPMLYNVQTTDLTFIRKSEIHSQ